MALSKSPVFDTESRNFAEVDEVAGEERGVVSKGNGRDLQVHCADAEACHQQTVKLLYGVLIERQQRRRTVELKHPCEPLIRRDLALHHP